MDVTFTNVLEGARQYFQGVPAASSSTAGPPYPIAHETNPEMVAQYWPPQEAARPPTREQTPVQRPPSHQSDSSRPPSGHYQGYETTGGYQFARPQSREASQQNMNQQYQQQQYLQQPQHQQQQQQQRRNQNTPTSTSNHQGYHHQMVNQQQQQAYQSYQQTATQQQQQQRFYPQIKTPTSNSYKIGSNPVVQNPQENPYYKHLYTPHGGSLPYGPKVPETNRQQEQGVVQNQATSQAYRTTHNLPPIASLSLISYHSNRNSNSNNNSGDLTRGVKNQQQQQPLTSTSLSQTGVPTNQNNIPKVSSASNQMVRGSYEMTDYRNQYSQQQNNNRLPTGQNYQYNAAAPTTTTTTTTTPSQNYTQVIVTASNNTIYQNHAYYQNKLNNQNHQSQQSVVHQQQQQQPIATQSNDIVNGKMTPVKQPPKRESPLDLSVKTVRTPADSTLDDMTDNSKYYRQQNYQNYDNYASFQQQQQQQRGQISRSQATPSTVSAPKVEFHPNFNVSSLSGYRRPDKNLYQVNQPNRYPTVTIPTAAHVNSYIQSGQPKRENLPRMDFPTPGHGHKTSALYPTPTHDVQKKRPADTAPSIIPNKISKVDTWRQNIDQQIEQRLSSYKQQQAKHNSVANATVNGVNYTGTNPQTYQRPQYPQHVAYGQYGTQNTNHNQTYVPSAGVHQFPGGYAYSAAQNHYNQPHRTIPPSGVNKSIGGADKRVLSLLRNSLEIKGAKEAQKKLQEQKLTYENLKQGRLDIQHPSTDVTAPLQPKAGFISRHNVSPFTPTSFPDGGNLLYKLHIPKAVDSVNFDGTDRQLDDSQAMMTNHVNPNGDLDGLAAFLAARIRTKAELKQVGPSQNTNNNQFLERTNQSKSPFRGGIETNNPPKLSKERHAFPPRRRLFSRSEEEGGGSTMVPPRDKSGLRSSSETSVFDFPDSESETEMPVLERQTLEEMRRDRKSTSSKPNGDKTDDGIADDDLFAQACDSFVEQLKSGSGKKRGRRKKIESDVLAQLETVVTKDNILDPVLLIKKEGGDEDKTEEVAVETAKTEPAVEEDGDSDVPLINCKKQAESETKQATPKQLSSSLNDLNLVCEVKIEKTKMMENKGLFLPRPAKKPSFGDGSHFCPGWEEEVYKYKKSLRMPPSLIQVTRPPQYHRLSTSLPDLDPCPHSPTHSTIPDESKVKVKTESVIDDSDDSNHSFNVFSKSNYDSEGSSSIKSLPNTTKDGTSILDKLLQRYGGRKRRKYKRKDEVKIIPKSDQPIQLLPTPEKTNVATLGFRKKTVNNFKDVFRNKEVIKTRKQRNKKQGATIKEVFGEDRPASAPPVTCLDVKIKEEIPDPDDNLSLSNLLKKETNSEATVKFEEAKQALKVKLLNNRGRKESPLLKSLVDKRIKSELIEPDLEDDEASKGGNSKSETPSIDGDEGGVSGRKYRNKFRNIRRKLSSGFDYIRKKKKSVKKENQENSEGVIKPKRRGVMSKTNSGSVQDIQKEIKGWVLNKGIGETILHRSARLGYTVSILPH